MTRESTPNCLIYIEDMCSVERHAEVGIYSLLVPVYRE